MRSLFYQTTSKCPNKLWQLLIQNCYSTRSISVPLNRNRLKLSSSSNSTNLNFSSLVPVQFRRTITVNTGFLFFYLFFIYCQLFIYLIGSERSGPTTPPPKKHQKVPPTLDIALFLPSTPGQWHL